VEIKASRRLVVWFDGSIWRKEQAAPFFWSHVSLEKCFESMQDFFVRQCFFKIKPSSIIRAGGAHHPSSSVVCDLSEGRPCPRWCSETVTVAPAASSSASAAIVTVGNATAVKSVDEKPVGNNSARPIDVTSGRTQAADCIKCASATIGGGGPGPA
jgi:hypothetical protein